jgi:hypothetical protein
MATQRLVGSATVGVNNAGANNIIFCKFTALATGTVSQIKVYSLVAGNAKISVYNDNAGEPGNKLTGNNTGQACVIGWNVLTIADTPVVKDTPYWLGVIVDTTGTASSNNSAGTIRYKAQTYAGFTWPASAGTGYTGGTVEDSIGAWGILTISPSSISQVISIGSPTVARLKYITLAAGISQAIAIGMPVLGKSYASVPDLPDWMDSVNIVAARLNLPMFIKGAEVNIPISVAAWTIGTLSVDVIAQTVGNLLISVAAQSVGVYLQPEWAATQGTDKNFRASQSGLAFGFYAYYGYTVPAGKTIYVTHIGGYSYAFAAADADKNQVMAISIYDETAASYLFETGGNGGAFADLSKPISIAAGHTVWFMAWNLANHNCNMTISASGYEV